MNSNKLRDYFSGQKLYGDDFNSDEIAKWYAQEEEGYAELGAKNKQEYKYNYHTINVLHGYKNLKLGNKLDVLSIGGAYGDELLPIIDQIRSITILEPSEQLRQSDLNGIPILYLKPDVSGKILLQDASFDLVTCFSVLHHIPNVSYIIREVSRVLRDDGKFLLREPIVSMGDWTKSRPGLTLNERGIPRLLMRRFIKDAGLEISKEIPCMVKPFDLIFQSFLRTSPINSSTYLFFDRILSLIMSPFMKYHAYFVWQKVRPAYCFYLASKASTSS